MCMHTTHPGQCRQRSAEFLAGVGACQQKFFWQVLASCRVMILDLWNTVGVFLGGGRPR